MNLTRKLVTSLFLLLGLVFTQTCTNKKKPPLPPKDLAPTIAEALPEEIPEKPELQLPPRTDKADVPAPKETPKKAKKVPSKKPSSPANTPVASTQAPATAPVQTPPPQNTQQVAVMREPAAPEMTVAAAISSQAANKQKEDTARMIDTTEGALKGLTRQLNDEERGMRTQIETYLQQSRKATADGDYERAYKLAEKAQVLATALTKP